MKFYDDLENVMSHFTSTGGFLTSQSDKGVNTMTISWGFIGFIWNKPHFMVFVRPQRKTHDIMKDAKDFTISVPFGTMSEELMTCGTKSGFDIDKSEVVKFVKGKEVDSPIVAGCDMYYECKINSIRQFDKADIPEVFMKQFYNDDLHHIYYGEIVSCYSK